ncbi:unnamed protein product, partial [Mesorhabditis belari]|uniref:Uncharacterized protein n=1 Tax=Mesorhabditis belari TaxID=2138241 RepID=A0AAF3EA35_9BILA
MNVIIGVLSTLFGFLSLVGAECGKNVTEFCPRYEYRLIKKRADGFLGAIWEDKTRIVEVVDGCLLQAWDLRNQTGASRALGLDGRSFYDLSHYAFANRISSLKCTCV